MYITAQRTRWETLRVLAAEDISPTYVPLGDSLENPARIIKMVNTTDVDILVSTNGSDDMDVCPAGGFFLYDIMSNKSEQSCMFVDQGTVFYISGEPTTGSVYLVVIYTSAS